MRIASRDLVLLFLDIGGSGLGITRLQKFLYLLEQEEHLQPDGEGFAFEAYKAGPCSTKLYDDLEFLENLGLVESQVAAEATDPEAAEVDLLSFEELMGDSAEMLGEQPADGFGAADAYEEHQFRVTDKGAAKVKAMIQTGEYQPMLDGIQRIKSNYGQYSLSDLLYYVYTKYPHMAMESEIKDRVLSGGRLT